MTRIDLSNMPTPDLIREFEGIAIQQSYAETKGDRRRFKKLFDLERTVVEELKKRSDLHRLAELFDHPNPWVRLQASRRALTAVPDEARAVLQALRERKLLPEALYAGMTLSGLERGWFTVE